MFLTNKSVSKKVTKQGVIGVFFAFLFITMIFTILSVGLFYQFFWWEAFPIGIMFLVFLLVFCLYHSGKNIRICSKCGNEIKSNAEFCESCGTRMHLYCPSCKTKIQGTPRYCQNCGFNLSVEPSGEIPEKVKTPIATSEVEPKPGFCPGCGTKVSAKAKFCPLCGTEI